MSKYFADGGVKMNSCEVPGGTASTQLPDGCNEVAEEENDLVNHPHHYTYGSIECIDFIDSCGLGMAFCAGNAMKYLTRFQHKGTPVQDLEKVIWYVTHLKEKIEDGTYKV